MNKNKKYYITLFVLSILYTQSLDSLLLQQQNVQSNKNNEYKLLNEYLELFQYDKTNYQYLIKIKEILVKKGEYEELISIYEQHIESILESNKLFERKVELLEIKIWADERDWKEFLISIINLEKDNQTKLEYILYKLIQNKKIDVAYELVQNFRIKNNKPHFFSKKLISVFKENNRNKDTIEESLIYLIFGSTKKNNSVINKIIIEQLFKECDKILESALIDNFILPISDKQFSSNTFLNSNFYEIQKTEDIQYVINVYKKLIEYEINYEKAKLRLADINYNILSDFDNAYIIYNEIEKESSKISIDTEAILGKADILISKGYLDSAQSIINHQKILLKNFTSNKAKQDLINDLDYKNTQILFYEGSYQELNLSLDSLIKKLELKNKNCNDLLEVKTMALFFNQEQEIFKKYSSIQHKIKMNKSFESILELIQLMGTENMLINELAQFQYAIIELEKGNAKNAQQIIATMNQKTIFYELSLIINAEIEDHINKNYKEAIKLYEKFIEKYPNSIYKENILQRLNQLYQLLMEDLDL